MTDHYQFRFVGAYGIRPLPLRDPQVFLPRLSQVVNAIVGDSWWFDLNTLRDKISDQSL
ncbi:MAG: hypothetical protein WC216_00770 [Gallionella sp.]|jgi:hypothetical protein